MSMKGRSATIPAMKKAVKTRGALENALDILSIVTPLARNCGALCGAACCRTDEEGRGGMLLFPGEEAQYVSLPEGFALNADDSLVSGGTLLTCKGTCMRHTRPMACRVFPLMFFINSEGRPDVRLDPRAWPICPLMPSGMEGLRVDFVDAARQAAEALCSDPKQKEFIIAQQRAVEQMTAPLWQKEPTP